MKAAIWLRFIAGFYGLVLATITIFNWKGPDRFWLGALNLYMPQVMWVIPGILLTVIFFRADRSWTWLPLLCTLWVIGPIMGFCWSTNEPKPAPGDMTVRVMTWNIKYDRKNIKPLLDEIARCKPDVLFFQDAVFSLKGPLGDYFRSWQVCSYGQYVIVSRYSLTDAEVYELPFFGRKKENFLRCRMHIGRKSVSLYNVHFKTPRQSIKAFKATKNRPGKLPEIIQTLEDNVQTRIDQAATVREFLKEETGPVIVAGDFNAPEYSLVCETLRNAGLRDAFSEGGRGYGFTYGHFLLKNRLPWLRVSWMRIDHIMVGSGFKTKRCWVGTGKASAHRPVIAELILK